MPSSSCVICNSFVENVEYDLLKTKTVYSATSLLKLLQSFMEEELEAQNVAICQICYVLLNELDNLQIQVKGIQNQLKIFYKNRTKKTKRKETDQQEECTVCFKKFHCKELKAHLKTVHSDLNDLEASIDFDEVAIDEINPTLEDITVLNTAEDNNEKITSGETSGEVVNQVESSNVFKTDDIPIKSHQCSECSKIFKTGSELKNHLMTHSKERPFICEICGQGYKRQQALTIHVGMHQGINQFTCNYCNKSFTQKGGLMRHLPIHTGQMPYQCDLCGKRFIHHTSFNMHKASHNGQRSHKCDICGLTLLSTSHLKRHTRVHTGEKKFACGVCGRKFAEKYNLAVHEKIHSGVNKTKKFQCQICNNVYSRRARLEEHLLYVHQKIFQGSEIEIDYCLSKS